MKLRVFFVSLLVASSAFADTCPQDDIGEYLAHEEPRLKGFIEKRSPNQNLIDGFQLCDGSVLFKQWSYLGKAKIEYGQQVFLFKHDGIAKAIAWVEPGGVPLPLTNCPKQSDCSEGGHYVLSGDNYTWTKIQPEGSAGGNVVIIDHPLPEWIQSVDESK